MQNVRPPVNDFSLMNLQMEEKVGIAGIEMGDQFELAMQFGHI